MQNKWAAHCPHRFWQLGGSQPDLSPEYPGLNSHISDCPGWDHSLGPHCPEQLSSTAQSGRGTAQSCRGTAQILLKQSPSPAKAQPSTAKAQPSPAKTEQPARSILFWPVLLNHRIAVKCWLCVNTLYYTNQNNWFKIKKILPWSFWNCAVLPLSSGSSLFFISQEKLHRHACSNSSHQGITHGFCSNCSKFCSSTPKSFSALGLYIPLHTKDYLQHQWR